METQTPHGNNLCANLHCCLPNVITDPDPGTQMGIEAMALLHETSTSNNKRGCIACVYIRTPNEVSKRSVDVTQKFTLRGLFCTTSDLYVSVGGWS